MPDIDLDTYEQEKHRPAWIRRHRDALASISGLDIPRNLAELQAWLDDHRSVLTRRMRDHYTTETDEQTAADGGDN